MALTSGAKVFLGAAAAVGVGTYLYRRSAAATEHRGPIVTRSDISRFDESRTNKGTTMTPEWSRGSAYGDVGGAYKQQSAASGPIIKESNVRYESRVERGHTPGEEGFERATQSLERASDALSATVHDRPLLPGEEIGTTYTRGSREITTRGRSLGMGQEPRSSTIGTTTTLPRGQSQVDRTDVVREHGKAAAQDVRQTANEVGTISSIHSKAAGRDVSQAAREVKDSLTAPTLPGAAVVRDVPDVLSEGDREILRAEPTRSANRPEKQLNPTIKDRVQEAADVMGVHARAAVEDVKQVGGEIRDVLFEHREHAKDDVAHARKEISDVNRGAPKSTVEVRQTPRMAPASAELGKDQVKKVDPRY